jgi:2-keto-3-deoxygluconate permease
MRFTALAASVLLKKMKLRRATERVPGGFMLVPLACGAIITKIAPHAASFFGSFTSALFTLDPAVEEAEKQ